MPNLPSIELLESTHTFPGPYTFKVIGKVEDAFVARVVTVVRVELGLVADPDFSTREAAGGRHVSVTIQISIESAAHVRAVYRRLSEVVGVVMML